MSDPQIEVLDRFFAAMRAGDFAAWMAELGSEMTAEVEANVPAAEQAAFMEHQRSQAPESFEVVERIPERSELLIRAISGEDELRHAIVSFAEEDGALRISGLFDAPDPDAAATGEIEKAADDIRGEVDDYDRNRTTSLGGPVVRTAYGDEYSLLVVRGVDSEQTVFLPTRPELEKAGIDPERVVPDAIVEIQGHPHASDDCKVLGTNLRVLSD